MISITGEFTSEDQLINKRIFALAAFVSALVTPFVRGQAIKTAWNTRLTGKPLYLRGFWRGDQLRFDKSGVLTVPSEPGPVTLSGVDVTSAMVNGDLLVIKAVRVALVRRADGQPGLERLPISSTTHIAFSLRRGDKQNYHAAEEMKILIEPDAGGEYEAALHKVFADGWEELAASVPLHWKCYATSYFADTISPDAEETVKRCVTTPKLDVASEGDRDHAHAIRAPVLIASHPVSGPLSGGGGARGLGVYGVSRIHLRVTSEGVPVGLQVIDALGAGADETALQAVSEYRFQPATLNGLAVPVDMSVNVSFR